MSPFSICMTCNILFPLKCIGLWYWRSNVGLTTVRIFLWHRYTLEAETLNTACNTIIKPGIPQKSYHISPGTSWMFSTINLNNYMHAQQCRCRHCWLHFRKCQKRFKTCISLLFGYGSILQNNYHYLFTNIFIHSSTQMTTKPRHATIQCDLSFNTLSAVRFYDISSTVLNDVILSKAALNCQ